MLASAPHPVFSILTPPADELRCDVPIPTPPADALRRAQPAAALRTSVPTSKQLCAMSTTPGTRSLYGGRPPFCPVVCYGERVRGDRRMRAVSLASLASLLHATRVICTPQRGNTTSTVFLI